MIDTFGFVANNLYEDTDGDRDEFCLTITSDNAPTEPIRLQGDVDFDVSGFAADISGKLQIHHVPYLQQYIMFNTCIFKHSVKYLMLHVFLM